jgi:hypothetical protein
MGAKDQRSRQSERGHAGVAGVANEAIRSAFDDRVAAFLLNADHCVWQARPGGPATLPTGYARLQTQRPESHVASIARP